MRRRITIDVRDTSRPATHHEYAGHARLANRVMLRRSSIGIRDCCHEIDGKRTSRVHCFDTRRQRVQIPIQRRPSMRHHETAGECTWVHGASVDTTRLDSVRACGRHCATHHDRQRITNLAEHARLAIRVMLRRISIDVRDCCHKIAGKRITNLRDTPDLKTE
ncbi:hypothetical protein Bbelb_193980 [Branchiostoma belcheri]|nr:hypothetical protein Bbelb_193980 [Branchiostoma belcheri]